MTVKHLFSGARFIGEAEGERRTYYVFQGERPSSGHSSVAQAGRISKLPFFEDVSSSPKGIA
jgi:hypothetical protein